MDLASRSASFWYNLRMSAILFPYFRKELDRKYNFLSRIRKLKETDSDLPESLKGKVCVMTGGTRGIGAEVVKILLKKECYVIVGSSSKKTEDNQKTHDLFRAEVPADKGNLEIWHLNLKSMDSVVEFTQRLKDSKLPINYFIANAGIGYHDLELTKDGFEQTFAVNYLSHCLLIDRIIDIMYETSKTSDSESRIVLVSSCVHKAASRINFDDIMLQKSKDAKVFAYGQSKMALIMFAIRMDRWLKEKGEDWSSKITINSLHPGLCNTQLLSHVTLIEELRPMANLAFRTSKEGAETTIYCALSSQMIGVSGKYLEDCAIALPSAAAQNYDDQNKLWKITWQLLDKWAIHDWL